MTDAGAPPPDHRDQGGFDLGGKPDAAKPYRVLARKYRPSSFDDLIGQEAMVRTVSNAFETGRIPQAWILTVVRGVGKTTTARILARALNYELPDGSAKGPTIAMPKLGVHCQAIMESRHMDVLEMDAASHTGVDDVRQINDSVRYAPASARYKVYIIDEVHMLSTAAFNAFLKTLEEPPALCAPMRCGRCLGSPTAPASSTSSRSPPAAISPPPSRNSASSMTSAPIRSWCCRTSPNSSISSPA